MERLGKLDEVGYARARLPNRTYVSRAFPLRLPFSRDHGQPARYINKVFDEREFEEDERLQRTEEIVQTSPGGRKQIRLQVAREAGSVRELLIQRVPTSPGASKLETLLKLDRAGAERLIDLVKSLEHVPVDGDEERVRVDDSLLRDVFADPDAVGRIYERDREAFRELIANDASADDVVAVARRRRVVDRFRQLLTEPAAFAEVMEAAGGKKEHAWQRFFEDNPWILGITLAGQLLTSWDEHKLEQVVAGFSVAGSGKRTDALLRTNGAIRSLVFAEIKHHETPLLGNEYRSGAWGVSPELAGGVSQLQQTVYRARQDIGEWLAKTDAEGADTREVTSLVRPRSYLIIGHLNQLRGEAGIHQGRHRSFELNRRNLYEPEIVTFDELLARAEWHVLNASRPES